MTIHKELFIEDSSVQKKLKKIKYMIMKKFYQNVQEIKDEKRLMKKKLEKVT